MLARDLGISADRDLFYAWTYDVAFLAVGPIILEALMFNCSICVFGQLPTNMAASFDVAAAYVLEVLLGMVNFSMTSFTFLLSLGSTTEAANHLKLE